MDQQEKQAYIDAMHAHIAKLDAEADKLEAEARAEYEASRDNLQGRLKAWQDEIEADWEIAKANIDEGYHELEAKWHHLTS